MRLRTKNLNYQLSYYYCFYCCWNKIPDHSKYITIPEFNNLAAKHFAARIAQANLANMSDTAYLVKKIDFDDKLKDFNEKITSNKTKITLLK